MDDKTFLKKYNRVRKACQECYACAYGGPCTTERSNDILDVISEYDERLWQKTAEVEKLKKELRNAKAQPPITVDQEMLKQPLISKNWYMDVAKFIRKNLFVEIRCDESLEDIDYIRNVLDAEAAIRAAYGEGSVDK